MFEAADVCNISPRTAFELSLVIWSEGTPLATAPSLPLLRPDDAEALLKLPALLPRGSRSEHDGYNILSKFRHLEDILGEFGWWQGKGSLMPLNSWDQVESLL